MQNLKSELEEAILKKVMTEQFNQDADMKPIEQEKTPVNVEDILDNNLITGVTQKMMDDGFDIKSDEIKKLFANEVVNRLSQTTETNDSTSFLMKKFPHLQSNNIS